MFKTNGRLRRGASVGLLAGAAALGTGCAVSTQQEVQAGAQEAAQVNQQLPIVQDAALDRYINGLGNQLASHGQRNIPFHFFIVNSNVVNAFSLEGGYVYINRGIIEHASNLSELAGVVGHEIGHVENRDVVTQQQRLQGANIGIALASVLLGQQPGALAQTAVNVGGTAVFAHYSRQDESNADAASVKLTTAAGISPQGLVTFFHKLLQMRQSQPGLFDQWFATHPTEEQRIADTQQLVSQVPASRLRSLTTDTRAFETFKARMAQYPAPPPGANGQ